MQFTSTEHRQGEEGDVAIHKYRTQTGWSAGSCCNSQTQNTDRVGWVMLQFSIPKHRQGSVGDVEIHKHKTQTGWGRRRCNSQSQNTARVGQRCGNSLYKLPCSVLRNLNLSEPAFFQWSRSRDSKAAPDPATNSPKLFSKTIKYFKLSKPNR